MNIDRLRGLMDDHNMSQAELARAVGATQGSIQQILSGTTQRSRLLPDIARRFGVSVEYLLGTSDDPTTARRAAEWGFEERGVDDDRIVGIQMIDLSYGMGGGTFVEQFPEDQTAYLGYDLIRTITRAPSTMLFMAKGVGDSMMPTMLDQDTIIVDRSRNSIDVQDRIWALMYGDLGMVKRVRRLPEERLVIMSDNENVSDMECHISEVRVIGRVVWIARQI